MYQSSIPWQSTDKSVHNEREKTLFYVSIRKPRARKPFALITVFSRELAEKELERLLSENPGMIGEIY